MFWNKAPGSRFKYFCPEGALDKTNNATEVQRSKNCDVPHLSTAPFLNFHEAVFCTRYFVKHK